MPAQIIAGIYIWQSWYCVYLVHTLKICIKELAKLGFHDFVEDFQSLVAIKETKLHQKHSWFTQWSWCLTFHLQSIAGKGMVPLLLYFLTLLWGTWAAGHQADSWPVFSFPCENVQDLFHENYFMCIHYWALFSPNITSVSKVRLQTHAVIVLIFYSVSSFPALIGTWPLFYPSDASI